MQELWRKRRTAPKPFDATNNISFLDISDYLPYKRLYCKLNSEELLQLIKDAKQNRWELLDLSKCGLTALPDELWELTDLKCLWLYNNNIKILPKNIEKLQNLEYLDIFDNPITCDNNRPLNLPKLVNLNCCGCDFPQLPKAFQIPSLKVLLFNCLEETLSDDILKLKNLQKLYLSYSNIAQLPDNIRLLENLETLWLNHTKISSLPDSFANLKNLKKLDLGYTPLSKKLPHEILVQDAQEIILYALKMQSGAETKFINESKMVIVGQGSVGKTSVLNRLIHNKYVEQPSTEGIDIQTWDFEELGENYRLNVWDFGGQEIYHSTHQFFLSQRSLYLFVWDARAEDEYGKIDYWLKTLQSLAGDSPIIIVVNKCDIHTKRIRVIDKFDIQRRFPQVIDFLHISCKDGTGIEDLRNLVKQTALELPLMKQKWFASWLNVRKEIEKLSKKENIISYTDYLKICKDNKINDDNEALSLIRFLHDLGIVLHYHDDSLLKHIVILSTEWVTDAVYKVLDEQEGQLKGENGILPLSFLPFIWDDKERYPEDKYNYLLTLMEKFQLAFKVDNEKYLVAELLENNEITLDYTFPHEKTLAFRYEYDFIPAGIMTRFIVLTNQYLVEKSDQKQCWAKGAYLKYGNAYALVKLHDNLTEHFVDIKISGGLPHERRELLTIIREILNQINKRFKDIKITEQIPCNCSPNCTHLFNYKDILNGLNLGKTNILCPKTWMDVNIQDCLNLYIDKNNYDIPSIPSVHFLSSIPDIHINCNPIQPEKPNDKKAESPVSLNLNKNTDNKNIFIANSFTGTQLPKEKVEKNVEKKENYLIAKSLPKNEIRLPYSFLYNETVEFRYEYDSLLPDTIIIEIIKSLNDYIEERDGTKQCWIEGAYLKYKNTYSLIKIQNKKIPHFVEIKISGGTPQERSEFTKIIRKQFHIIHFQNDLTDTQKIPCICTPNCKRFFDYEDIVSGYQHKKSDVTCLGSWLAVNIGQLLEGDELIMNKHRDYLTKDKDKDKDPVVVNVHQNNTNTSQSTSTATATAENTITIEIKNLINGLQGDYNALKKALKNDMDEIKKDCETAEDILEQLDQCENEDEIVKKGVLNDLDDFLEDTLDKTTKLNSIIKNSTKAFKHFKNFVKKFMQIATKVGFSAAPIIKQFVQQISNQ